MLNISFNFAKLLICISIFHMDLCLWGTMRYKHGRHAVWRAVFFSLQTVHKLMNRDPCKQTQAGEHLAWYLYWWLDEDDPTIYFPLLRTSCGNHPGLHITWLLCFSTSSMTSLRSSWQAHIQATIGQKPPWQTKVLISLIINQYAAGSPSGEDFTDWMHLFSRTQQGVNGGMEEKTRTFLTPVLGGTQDANKVEERLIFSFKGCF